jgi:hypothetical protein
MRSNILLPLAAALCLLSLPASAQKAPATETAAASAEVKIGLGVEKSELTGAAETFKVAAGTKIYAWTKVTGAAESKITIVFLKAEKEISKQELDVPRSPYRTNAYRTFRAGDGGAWTASVRSADGQELGKAAFKVEVE